MGNGNTRARITYPVDVMETYGEDQEAFGIQIVLVEKAVDGFVYDITGLRDDVDSFLYYLDWPENLTTYLED